MEFELIDHARERMVERGATEEDISAVFAEGRHLPARRGRQMREKVFIFEGTWKGRNYPQKKVRVVFVEELGRLTVITVYAYYGRWEEEA